MGHQEGAFAGKLGTPQLIAPQLGSTPCLVHALRLACRGSAPSALSAQPRDTRPCTHAPFVQVTSLSGMFPTASAEVMDFNDDISKWDISSVTTMADAFSFATSFNADISEWDVSSVTDMSKAFYACNTFDADISKWDVSAVENFEAAFYGNFAFNQDLSSWDTSAATTMNQMFRVCKSLNQDLNSWNVEKVVDMNLMFYSAKSFNQTLCWDMSTPGDGKSDAMMFWDSPGEIATSPCA
mmetsp:Transcript_41810/g.96719  ORF Transcript_41810/g.96719 Transcript_41810/m.96719 type:complete len:239 (-) Transcript_41810:797-1513(-)